MTCAINTFGFDQGYGGSKREAADKAREAREFDGSEHTATPVGLMKDPPPPTDQVTVNPSTTAGSTAPAVTTGEGREI